MSVDWNTIGNGFDRQAYLREQREQHGRKLVYVLPGDVPLEVLTALDLLGVELWGLPPGLAGLAPPRLPSYICSVARQASQLFAADGAAAAAIDGLIVPSTCDSLKVLGSLLAELRTLPCPVIAYDPGCASRGSRPGEPRDEALRAVLDPFRRVELGALVQACEELAGRRLEPTRLQQALRTHAEVERLGRELYRQRASLVLGERRVLELLRSREYLQVDDQLAVLRQALAYVEAHAAGPHTDRVPILLCGLVPEPMELLDRIEEAGLRVAADDLLALGRRWRPPLPDGDAGSLPSPGNGPAAPSPAERNGGPAEQLLQRMAALPPAPTRCNLRTGRRSWLLSEVHRSGARGVLSLVVKFCEPELFELPARQEALNGAHIPSLFLEHELGVPPGGSVVTRLEAFREVLR